MLNAKQLIAIYLFVIVFTFILLNVLTKKCRLSDKNLWWASVIASFVIAICILFLEVPINNEDDQLLIILIVISLFFPIIVTIYLACQYGCWYNKPLPCECDTC
jgi:predicted CDP-diglyceride synthetase/phosphatidate cytidylyltransferase